MNVPSLFGVAPTLTHDEIASTGQDYGSSSLPGAPINQPTMSPAGFIPPINIGPIYPTGIPWHTGQTGLTVTPTTGGSDSPVTTRPSIPTGPAYSPSDYVSATPVQKAVLSGNAGEQVTTAPAGTATTPADTTGAGDVVGRLIDLASSQQGGGGGGGGLVALPTGIDTTGASSSSGGGLSKATIFFLVAVVAIGVWYYIKHKKKSGEKGKEAPAKEHKE